MKSSILAGSQTRRSEERKEEKNQAVGECLANI